jgi:hypothetical protein
MHSGQNEQPFEPTIERRKDRCETTLGALTRLLEAARRRSDLDAVALCDRAGFLVAGAGAARLCDELAAYAPMLAAGETPANDTLPSSLMARERKFRVQRLSIDGIEVLLCESGAQSSDFTALAEGCQRILGSSAPRWS